MQPRPRSLAIVLACLVLIVHAAAFGWYVADDAAISLAYARNLAHGAGLVLTPGDAPVEAYSNPLWVALLVPGAMLGGAAHPQWLLKPLGLVFALAALVAVRRLATRAYGADDVTAAAAPVLLAAMTPFAFWAVAGLENPLYAFLLVAAAAAYLREQEDAGSWNGLSAIFLALLALTRPEGIAFAATFLAHRVMTGDSIRRTARWFAGIAVPIAVFLAWRHWYFDAWLPNTFQAKLDTRHLGSVAQYAFAPDDPGRRYVAGFLWRFAAVLLVAAYGLADRRYWRAGLLFAGILATDVLFVLYAGGDWWPAFRFMTVLLPFVAVAAAHGLSRLLPVLVAGPIRTAAVTAAVAVSLFPNARVLADLWSRDPQSLISLESRLALAARVRMLAALAHLDDPVLLEPDIGGPSLAGGLRVVDLAMLADVHLARFHYYPRFFRQYVFEEQRPDFIHTHSVWSRASRLATYPELRRDYLTISERAESEQLAGLFVRKDRFVRGATPEDVPVARFGEIELVSFEAAPGEVSVRGPLTFAWEWRCPDGCSRDYRLYLRAGSVSWGLNPVFGWYRTTAWDRGEVIGTTQDVVSREFGPGVYDVEVAAAPPGETPRYVRVGSLQVAEEARAAASAFMRNDRRWNDRRRPDSRPDAGDMRTRHDDDTAALLARAEQETARHDYLAAFSTLRRARTADPSAVRVLHRLEDARERAWWIDYDADTGQLDRLERSYRREAAAHALPADPALLEKLYYALLPTIDRASMPALRRDTGRESRERTFSEDGVPAIDLVDYRVDRGDWGVENRLVLYFDVRRPPARDYQIWIHAYTKDGRRLTAAIDPTLPAHAWPLGRRVESHVFHLPPGDYELRAGFWQPSGRARLCPDGRTDTCYVLLGTHRFAP